MTTKNSCKFYFILNLVRFFFSLLIETIFESKVSPGGIATTGMVISSNQDFHSAFPTPMSSSVDNALCHQSSSLPNTLASPMRMASAIKQFGFCESSNSLDEIKFGNQGIHSFHPHSFPENHDGLAHGIPCNPPTAIPNITNLGLGITEGYINHVHGVNANQLPREVKGGMICLCFSFADLLMVAIFDR